MKTLSITLEDNKLDLLENRAKEFGLPLNDLITATVDDLISKSDKEFEKAMKYVIKKNKSLYERFCI